MKRFLSAILLIIFAFSLSFVLVSCGDGDNDDGKPVYSTEFSYNETHHWRNQLNGTGTIEYGLHREDSGWCSVCHLYFECPNLRYEKVTINGVEGYEVTEFNDLDESEVIVNVEVPKYYQGEDDNEPLPVISIGKGAFNCSTNSLAKTTTAIKSIKLNEGLLSIGNHAFTGSDIKELVIPDSVFGNYLGDKYRYGLMAIAVDCTMLEKVVIGNGVKVLAGSNFTGCIKLKEITFGNSLEEIRPRNFFYDYDISYAVIPASLVSIPEDSIYSNKFYHRLYGIFETKSTKLYFEITKEQYDVLIIPAKKRDLATGAILSPDTTALTTRGFTEGWDNGLTMYFSGEWHYDNKGKPVPNVT